MSSYDSGAGTSLVSMNEQREERLGQLHESTSRRSWRDVPAQPARMKANLGDFELVKVDSPDGELPVNRLTDQSRALSAARFGEMFTGCMKSEACSRSLKAWLRERTGKKRQTKFVVTVPDQGSNSSYQEVAFDFREHTMESRTVSSGLIRNGAIVIVSKGYLSRSGITFLG
jgi:hypothetical protein